MGIIVWTPEQTADLRTLHTQGVSTAEIGRLLGFSKNAVVGKTHRLDLDARKSPLSATRTPEKCALVESLLRNGMPVKQVARQTHSDVNYVRAARNALGLPAWGPSRSSWLPPRSQFDESCNMDMFDDPTFEPKPERETSARVVPFLAPAARRGAVGGCRYPMWGHNERTKFRPDGTAMLCDDTISRGDYCTEHAALCYSRPARAAA